MSKHFHEPRVPRHRLSQKCIQYIKLLASAGMRNDAILLNVRKVAQPGSPDAYVNKKDVQNIARTVREGRLSDRDIDSVAQHVLSNNTTEFPKRQVHLHRR